MSNARMAKYPSKIQTVALAMVVLFAPCVGGLVVAQEGAPAAQDADDAVSAQGMATVKGRLVAAQLPVGAEAMRTLQETAAQLRDTVGMDGKWPGIKYEDTGLAEWGPSHHLDNVLVMTRA